jgi:hypothetical protein
MTKTFFALLFIVLSTALQAQFPDPVYNTPGVYTWNTGNMIFDTVTIRAWGGGGGGGVSDSNGDGAGGGGGGAFAERTFATLGPNQTITLTVGAGGLAGISAENFAGGTGGVSMVQTGNNVVVAGGGQGGGQAGRSSGGNGGTPTGHDAGRGFSGGNGSNADKKKGGAGASSAGTHANGNNGNGGNQTPAPAGGGFGGAGGTNQESGKLGGFPGGGAGGGGTSSANGGHGQITISYLAVREGAPLPVELTRFELRPAAGDVVLLWETASEQNNDYFQVEHSRDGRRFEVIAALNGRGTTQVTQQYEFLHQQPGAGTHYYRLRQVDFDGRYEYSPIRVIEVEGTEAVAPFRAWSDGAQVWVEDCRAEGPGSFRILDLHCRVLSVFFQEKGSVARAGFGMPAVPGGIYLLQWHPASGVAGQTVKFLHGAF